MSLWINEVKPSAATTTIVFLHGLGVSSWMWRQQVEVWRIKHLDYLWSKWIQYGGAQ